MIQKNSSRRVPVSVLTGFLGSGKTTVLNYLIQHRALNRTLVLINEFGEIGLDHELVTHSKDEVVVEMSSGCLCCSIRGDLVRTLREAPGRFWHAGRQAFDRVLIETTGLADPAPILHTLMTEPDIARRYRLDGVIATVDAANGENTLNHQYESVKQAAMSDRLLLTKTDLVDLEKVTRLQERLRALNPAAPQIVAENGAVDPTLLIDACLHNPRTRNPDVQSWLKAEAYRKPLGNGDKVDGSSHTHQHSDINRHDAHIKALCLTIDNPISGSALDAWLETLLLLRGADFLRVKGIINVAELDGPIAIHGVQHIFHPPVRLGHWPSEDRRSRIVFITRKIDESILLDTLALFTEEQTLPPHRPTGSDNAMVEVRP